MQSGLGSFALGSFAHDQGIGDQRQLGGWSSNHFNFGTGELIIFLIWEIHTGGNTCRFVAVQGVTPVL